jgi:large subunit ribosomal protein L19
MATNKNIITAVNADERKNLALRSGDTIRVWQKIKEKDKTRLQAFEGLVLSRKHGTEAGATFTVRKVMDGVGVERIYPLYSPIIDKIEVLRRSKVRRAKLYYIREKAAKEIRRGLRKMLALEPGQNTDTKIAAPVEAVAEEKKGEVKA